MASWPASSSGGEAGDIIRNPQIYDLIEERRIEFRLGS